MFMLTTELEAAQDIYRRIDEVMHEIKDNIESGKEERARREQ